MGSMEFVPQTLSEYENPEDLLVKNLSPDDKINIFKNEKPSRSLFTNGAQSKDLNGGKKI